jgi:hypothetical protein
METKTIETPAILYKPQISSALHGNPCFSFGYHFDNDYDNKLPGVGSYELKAHSSSFQKIQNNFGFSHRPLPYGDEHKVPGPGNYKTVDFARTTKISFPRTERSPNKKKDDPPGQYYDIAPKQKAPKNTRFYDIKAKKRETHIFVKNDNPAPSHYNV